MDAGLAVAVVLAVAFAITNGFLDAASSIAALVETRGATPLQAVVLASAFNLLGPLLIGAAVANTIGGIVSVPSSASNRVIGAGLASAVTWNLVAWRRGLPSSSGQPLVGGLVGAALAEGGIEAVNWGGLQGGRPVGVFGTVISLAVSPALGALCALGVIRALRRLGRRATRRWRAPVRGGQWAMAAALAFSHGANDAQKSVGVIAALLLASGRISTLAAALGHAAVRSGADCRHGSGRMADHSHGGPRYLPHPVARGVGEHGRVCGSHLWGLAGRRADIYLSSRRVVGRRRRRWPLALASRTLGAGPSDGHRVVDHAAEYVCVGRRHIRALGAAEMSRGRWFLPETPDVLGLLREQLGVTIEGVDAFGAWAGGETAAAELVREAEHRGDVAKRALLGALRAAFVTPLEPEDVFALSRGVDWILDYTRDLVSESEVMACAPDAVIAQMAGLLAEAVRDIDRALAHLGSNEDAATDAADAAIKAERSLQRTYYNGMGALLEVDSRSERIARRELYRRCLRIGEMVIDVAERVVYAVVKQT